MPTVNLSPETHQRVCQAALDLRTKRNQRVTIQAVVQEAVEFYLDCLAAHDQMLQTLGERQGGPAVLPMQRLVKEAITLHLKDLAAAAVANPH